MAGDGDAERLVVLLEARIKDFEKNMAKASGTATSSYRRMRRSSKTATGQMEGDMRRSTSRINQALATTSSKIGIFGKTLVAGLVAGGVAGAISQIGQIASGIAEIGDEAKRAGIDVEAFQELKYVAEQNRIGVDSLTDGIKEMNLRADEFITTGKGSAAEAFQRIGYSAEDLKEKLKDPSALFTEIIGKLGQLDRAAQIRVADELFGGTGGEKFVQLIEQGEAGIQRTIDEARNLGIVMDEELIAKAEEVDRKFNQIANTVGTKLKSAIIEAADLLTIFLEQFQSVDFRSHIRPLQNELISIEEQRFDLQEKVAEIKATIAAGGEDNPLSLALESSLRDGEQKLDALTDKALELQERIYQLQGKGATVPLTTSTSTPPKKSKGDKGDGGRKSSAAAAERQAKAVQNLIAGLEFEKSLIGLSATEQAKLTALRKAGSAATDAQKEQITELVQTLEDEAARVEIVKANMSSNDILEQEMVRLKDLLDRGVIEWDEYRAAVERAQGVVSDNTGKMAGKVGDILGSLGSVMESAGAEQFEVVKALSMGMAVLKGFEAVQSAYAAGAAIPGGGPFTGALYAAAAGAASAAQIAAIASTTKNSTSMGAGAASSKPSIPAPSQDTAGTGRVTNVTLQGASMYSGEMLAEILNEYTADGGKVNWRTA